MRQSNPLFKTTLALGLALCIVGSVSAQSMAPKKAPGNVNDTAKGQMMDKNNDGQISSAEHAEASKTMFAMMDTNGDGVVTAAEMDAARAKSGHATGKMTSAEMIKKGDKNNDGNLSANEATDSALSMFTMMDTDANGMLSKAEMEKADKTMDHAAHK